MSDRRWCAGCGVTLQLGQRCGFCTWPGVKVDPNPEATAVAALQRDYAAAVEEQARKILKSPIDPFTYNSTTTTVPVYFENTTSTPKFAKIKKMENDMNVTANAIPTVGGHRAAVVRQGRVETFDGVGDEVLWESAKVYKTYDKAKAAAERRIADGLKAVFG